MKTNQSVTYLGFRILMALLLASATMLAHSQFNQQHTRGPRHRGDSHPKDPPYTGTNFGAALPNLTTRELADFLTGREAFEEEDTVESGLGPVFNNVSCVACHSSPVSGGSSTIVETRFGRMVAGHFDPMPEWGGSLMATFAIVPECQETLPPAATIVAHRRTTPVFGLGLIEAIPDNTILQAARRSKPDGITGRASIIQDVATGQMRVGRFGWKAQQATLLAFAGDAYLNEVGITSRLFPHDNSPNGNTNLLALYDEVADPEDAIDPATGKADIDYFADFMRFLAPPPRLPSTPSISAGNSLFARIGCAVCHIPVMLTGRNSIRALDSRPVPLYSDLLLHDMGSLSDGIGQAAASPREMKTPPLWGLRANPIYLHDGRATTVDAAIRAHAGEGARSRERYLQLSPAERQSLLDFLHSI